MQKSISLLLLFIIVSFNVVIKAQTLVFPSNINAPAGSTFTIEISAQDFQNNIIGIEISVLLPSGIEILDINTVLAGFNSSHFNVTDPNKVAIAYADINNPISLANGSTIFTLRVRANVNISGGVAVLTNSPTGNPPIVINSNFSESSITSIGGTFVLGGTNGANLSTNTGSSPVNVEFIGILLVIIFLYKTLNNHEF